MNQVNGYQQLYPPKPELKRASEIAQPPPRHQPEPEARQTPPAETPGKASTVGISIAAVYEDMPVTVTVQIPLTIKNLKALREKLRKLGLDPIPAPVTWTPEGLPLCPRHRIVMSKRDKQGDIWYSHALKDGDGNAIIDKHGDPVYCRGHQHKSSPGWDL